jgi:hypothetical protein
MVFGFRQIAGFELWLPQLRVFFSAARIGTQGWQVSDRSGSMGACTDGFFVAGNRTVRLIVLFANAAKNGGAV